jgi:hypothetical protein
MDDDYEEEECLIYGGEDDNIDNDLETMLESDEDDTEPSIRKIKGGKEEDEQEEDAEDIEIDDLVSLSPEKEPDISIGKNKTVHAIYITGDRRITSNRMSKFEFVRVLCSRVELLDDDPTKFVPIDISLLANNEHLKIALLEIIMKKCPLSIIRETDSGPEYWSVNEMEFDPEFIKNLGPDVANFHIYNTNTPDSTPKLT